MNPRISIIVPTFREAENLPLLVPAIAAAMATRGWTWEVIIVDDNSPDATPTVLAELAHQFPQCRSLIRTTDRGLSSAVLAGLAIANHELLVVMDADLSHPADAIPAMIDRLIHNHADFVIGSRYVPGGSTHDWSRLRWLNSFGATLLAKPLVGSIHDPMSGFFALRAASLPGADPLNPIGYKIALELLSKTRIDPRRVAEVPILFKNRVHGESKLTFKEQFRYLEHLSRLYDYKFPKASPRSKFLIAAGCGALACVSVLGMLHHLGTPNAVSIAAGLIAMILITFAFFARYVRTQRDFLVMKRPHTEFLCISAAEFAAGCATALSIHARLSTRIALALLIVVLVRYTLRKLFLHDLRGIRGKARPSHHFAITFPPLPQSPTSPPALAIVPNS
jgi:dolichol-phosphate mannosyltransferase